MSELVLSYLDVTKLAVAGFLARYREPTLGSYGDSRVIARVTATDIHRGNRRDGEE